MIANACELLFTLTCMIFFAIGVIPFLVFATIVEQLGITSWNAPAEAGLGILFMGGAITGLVMVIAGVITCLVLL